MTYTMTDSRECQDCNGSGVRITPGFTALNGTVYPERRWQCFICAGVGRLLALDEAAIRKAITGRKPRTLRSARPDDRRAYYVWRLARFHGGADVTMPIMATLLLGRDPYLPELDAMVDRVAREVFGTDLAAAHRWGRALGHLDRDMPGLPDSAYPSGRVADADKPEEEASELT